MPVPALPNTNMYTAGAHGVLSIHDQRGVQSVRTMVALHHLAWLPLDSAIIIRAVDWTPVRDVDLTDEGGPRRFDGRGFFVGHSRRSQERPGEW